MTGAGTEVLRIGTLGAARITPVALVRPTRTVSDVEVAAVAARDPERARKFARKHSIPRVHETYDELLADPDVDAIYNPLPNGLHAVWTIKALEAGKPVLCEKPFTANAAEAEAVAEVADRTGLVVMEAFHYRYHPLAERMRDIVTSGELGAVSHIDTAMCIPLPLPNDIRYRFDLAGGATMDVGAYAIHMQRLLSGAEPEVVRARAKRVRGTIDRWMRADLRYGDGRTGTMTCALWSARLFDIHVRVVGSEGELHVLNPTTPHMYHRVKVRTASGARREKVAGEATYWYQLRAFADAVLRDRPVLTPPSDSIATMRVIDAVYRAAGLPIRGEATG